MVYILNDRIMKALLGQEALLIGPTYWLSAHTNIGINPEPTGGGYARVATTMIRQNPNNLASGTLYNQDEVAFPTATANWGTIDRIGISLDPTSVPIERMLIPPTPISNGMALKIAAQQFTIVLLRTITQP